MRIYSNKVISKSKQGYLLNTINIIPERPNRIRESLNNQSIEDCNVRGLIGNTH